MSEELDKDYEDYKSKFSKDIPEDDIKEMYEEWKEILKQDL